MKDNNAIPYHCAVHSKLSAFLFFWIFSEKCEVIEDLYSEMDSVHDDNSALRDDLRALEAKNQSLEKSLQVCKLRS